MLRRLPILLAALAVLLAPATGSAEPPTEASSLAVVESARLPVVPSLDARYLTARPRLRLAAAPDQVPGCRPADFVFYVARDWLRLATKLAARASPCADYYFSIPPLVADKTRPRPNHAWRIRALGPRFHAMAEIHWTTWLNWSRANHRSMYDAGVEARRRMAAAGYDVANGDTWAVNEFPSSVRRNRGTARQDASDFVRGLYEGDGRPVQGAVFVIGVRHGTDNASLYKSTLKSWLGDRPFWLTMDRTVRFWAQEVYGDTRRWGVAGTTRGERREYLNDYLQHAVRLGAAAPDEYRAASDFLARTHTPIGNAGWQWPAGLGWTMVSGDQMQHFVSSQTYAFRNFAARRQWRDQFGFAWAPNNATAMPQQEFVAQSGQLLDRLGAALSASGAASGSDPGVRACAAYGHDWCGAEVEGASFTDAWRIFSAWDKVAPVVTDMYEHLLDRVRALVTRGRTRDPVTP